MRQRPMIDARPIDMAIAPAALPNSIDARSTAATHELARASVEAPEPSLSESLMTEESVRNPARNAAMISARKACMRSFVIRKMTVATEAIRTTNGHHDGPGAAAASKC